ncbi:hypothetical protein RRG08_058054 [Elysia crispata]|uniref:Uncharacterized protein n=1 Tax=Elysia crispata TaxID=231223 RepID=A0AAE0ZZL5_9GAST|nr:hypothetical protein RRG08_058054 [Elysia crispata]
MGASHFDKVPLLVISGLGRRAALSWLHIGGQLAVLDEFYHRTLVVATLAHNSFTSRPLAQVAHSGFPLEEDFAQFVVGFCEIWRSYVNYGTRLRKAEYRFGKEVDWVFVRG